MEGQLSIFDLPDKTVGYKYKFQRYMGQKVKFWRTGEVGKIVAIEPYYTIVETDECIMAGTPTTISPVEE